MTHAPYLGEFERDEAPQWERPRGVLAVYEAAPRPTWTTETPTHPGAWHVRLPGSDQSVVVQVIRDEATGGLIYGLPKLDFQPVHGSDVEWSSRACMEPA